MRYKNILGKDFKSKKDAKQYFNSVLYSIKKPDLPVTARAAQRHVRLTEETLIKHSDMEYLYNNYLTKDQKTLSTVFKGGKPYGWWCKIYREGGRNLAFEVETRNQSMIPISLERIFTCFGTAKFNKLLMEKKVARYLVNDERYHYLKNFVTSEKRHFFIEDYNYECDNCNKLFPYKEIDVHHVIPFNDIFTEWRDDVWRDKLTPNSSFKWFEDTKVLSNGLVLSASASWCDFHHNIARYRKLCKSCHKKKTYG